jgi:UDP-N-acetylmuramoylalanine--D-glutamate ligase
MDIGTRIAVLGLGQSGTAVVRWALARRSAGEDAFVAAFVEHDSDALRAAAEGLRGLGAEVTLGTNEVPDLGFDLVVASPGIPPARPIMVSARRLGVPVISEVELAYRIASAPFVAVTGTNGKTTVTALVAHLLRAGGRRAVAVGNIGGLGTPAITAAAECDPDTILVCECSSFQLALTVDFRPTVSVLLNITPDHTDWHGSMDAYVADKARVFANQGPGDTAVIDVDDAGSAAFADPVGRSGAAVVRVSRSHALGSGAYVQDGILTLDTAAGPEPLVRADELLIRGDHNISNALAAAAAASAMGVPPEALRAGLRDFAPIEHRLEPAGVIGGVEYVNDSKATNPDAVLKALTAFDDRPLIVLLGGRNKGNDFGALADACAARCRMVVLYGESAPDLEAAFALRDVPSVSADGLATAVRAAADAARPGDVVVLSPACASFDEFTDYEHRGRVFRETVAGMKGTRG